MLFENFSVGVFLCSKRDCGCWKRRWQSYAYSHGRVDLDNEVIVISGKNSRWIPLNG